jgi:hypothetical protein
MAWWKSIVFIAVLPLTLLLLQLGFYLLAGLLEAGHDLKWKPCSHDTVNPRESRNTMP